MAPPANPDIAYAVLETAALPLSYRGVQATLNIWLNALDYKENFEFQR